MQSLAMASDADRPIVAAATCVKSVIASSAGACGPTRVGAGRVCVNTPGSAWEIEPSGGYSYSRMTMLLGTTGAADSRQSKPGSRAARNVSAEEFAGMLAVRGAPRLRLENLR